MSASDLPIAVGRGPFAGAIGNAASATAKHFAAVYGSELVMLPSLDVAPPAWTWGVKEVAIDVWHHAVYVTATTAAYELLSR